MDFIINLWIPILGVMIFSLAVFMIKYRVALKTISRDLIELCIANVIIKKIKHRLLKRTFHKDFVYSVIAMLVATVIGFLFQGYIGLPTYVIAFAAVMVLAVLTSKRVSIEKSFELVEWTTLFFFAGLFIMVAGVEKTGILEALSTWIATATDDLLYLSLLVLWISGIVSMILNNIPFVTVMIPVILGIQHELVGVDSSMLWWALSLGACLGGNGTMVGASANVVAGDLARKEGIHINFIEYLKFALPLTIGGLVVCSIYIFFRLA